MLILYIFLLSMAAHSNQVQTLSILPFNIHVQRCRRCTYPEWNYRICDTFWRIYLMADEGWSIRFNEKTLPLTPDNLVVIPAETSFRTESRKSATQFYVLFTMDPVVSPYKKGVYSLPLTAKAESLISELTEYLAEPASAGQENALVHTLRVKQLCYDCLAGLPKESMAIPSYSPEIEAVLEAISRNLKLPLSNEALARSAGMSVSAFIRKFHEETGQPPQKWVMGKRIDQAALLLSNSSKTIEAIAEETAFFDRNHLSRVFKQLKGIGPAGYRKQAERRG